MKKWCLLKTSDGQRGANGKKKVYEIVLDGTVLNTSWGMAEKASRQKAVQRFYSEASAKQAASLKLQEKLERGYVLAYEV